VLLSHFCPSLPPSTPRPCFDFNYLGRNSAPSNIYPNRSERLRSDVASSSWQPSCFSSMSTGTRPLTLLLLFFTTVFPVTGGVHTMLRFQHSTDISGNLNLQCLLTFSLVLRTEIYCKQCPYPSCCGLLNLNGAGSPELCSFPSNEAQIQKILTNEGNRCP
jgi:hypothetical protein